MDFKTLKDILTLSDIIDIVKRLGVNEVTPLQEQDGFITQTICHNTPGQGSHKLYYYHNDQIFHCYTECGSFDIIELVNKVKGYNSLSASMKYIATQLGIDTHSYGFNTKQEMISDWSFINSLYKRKKTHSVINLPLVEESLLNRFQEIYSQDWIAEGISVETMKKYGIKYSSSQQQIIIPHRNEKGELIGIRARNLNEEYCDLYGKYLPYRDIRGVQYNHPLSLNLFGLDKNIETIKRLKKIMICESEKGCLQSDSFYNDNNFTVALCGKNLSQWQIKKILELGVEEVIIALDKQYEEVGSVEYNAWQKYIRDRIIKPLAPYVKTYVLWDEEGVLGYKESPTDKGKDVLEYLMKNKIFVGCFK